MKILYHHRIASRDGMDVHITEIISAFKALGHDVMFVGPGSYNSSKFGGGGEASDSIRKYLPRFIGEIMEIAYDYLVTAPRLTKACKAFKPDIIYERNNLFLLAGARLARRHKIPFLLEVNAPLAEERARHGGLSLKRLAHWLDAKVWRAADHVFPVSHALAEIVEAKGVAADRITVVHNGVNKEMFHTGVDGASVRDRFGLEDAIVIGFTGFMRDWHGLDEVIALLPDLPKGKNVHFLVVGEGPARPMLESQAEELGVSERVHFAGLVSREEMPTYVAAFDVAILSKVTSYASPLKLFEYLAMEKVVVAPEQPNINEILPINYPGIYDQEAHGGLRETLLNVISRLTPGAQCPNDILPPQAKHWRENAETILRLSGVEGSVSNMPVDTKQEEYGQAWPQVQVVIPYYQKEAGILQRALASIVEQDYEGHIEALIVDDGSPFAPEQDCESVSWPANRSYRIIKQANAGPGAARNRALDAASPDAYIAFLDSDDWWLPNHIRRAVSALQKGYDVYTSNWKLIGGEKSGFELRNIDRSLLSGEHIDEGIFALNRPFLQQQLTAPVTKLSVLVLAPNVTSDVRFNNRLRSASEDKLYVIELACKTSKLAISFDTEACAGEGVNIYESKKWGTVEFFSVIADQTAGTKLILDLVDGCDDHYTDLLLARLHDHRHSFITNLAHLVRRGRLPVRWLAERMKNDPLTFWPGNWSEPTPPKNQPSPQQANGTD